MREPSLNVVGGGEQQEFVGPLGALVANFKRFRRLCERCVDLSLQLADLRIELNRLGPHHQD